LEKRAVIEITKTGKALIKISTARSPVLIQLISPFLPELSLKEETTSKNHLAKILGKNLYLEIALRTAPKRKFQSQS